MIEYALCVERDYGYLTSVDGFVPGVISLCCIDTTTASFLPMSEFGNRHYETIGVTVEPPVRERYGCIPKGSYELKMTRSPKFGKVLPEILGVKGRSGIRIHSGNTVHDTRGCVLVGYSAKTPGTLRDSCRVMQEVDSVIRKYRVRKIIITEDLPF